MIRPSYALKLARTKLHSKRGVLTASIIVSSTLFAVLIATIIVFTGAEKSALEFIKKAGNDRYLVKTSPNIPYKSLNFSNPPSLSDVREIKKFEKQYHKDLQNKYESLGIEYDKASQTSALLPAAYLPKTLPEEQRVTINWSSPVIEKMHTHKFEEYAKTATNKLSNLKKVGSKYGADGYYIVNKQSALPLFPSIRLIQNNKEDFSYSDLKMQDATSYGYYVNAIHNGSYSFTDQKLLDRYLLTTDSENLKGIPVVVSAQEAASLFGEKLGIGKEPEDASEKRTWIKEIQTKLNGQIYEACYRNSAEQVLLEKIQRDYIEMKNSERVDNYQRPHLIYDYPEDVCGNIVVKEDTRTDFEKHSDIRAEEMQKKLGTYVAPSHRLLTFQIVGIKYAQPFVDRSKGINGYIKNLLAPQDNSFVLDIPLQMYNTLPNKLKLDDIQQEQQHGAGFARRAISGDDFASRVLEFTTVDNARAFLDNETCTNTETDCDKKFIADPYGSNYLILDEIGELFSRVVSITFPAALGLATIIIWFTISRIMAENRKETAIYRAMGAKRRDITGIYIVYILLVALRIALVSLILGILAAFITDYFYGKTLTDTAVTLFGIIDNAPVFSLFNLSSLLLPVIIGSIFIVSIVACIQPLIRNTLRAPIDDIRDE